ncbi:hypothetical protein [Mesorhizobium sp. J428]|nr:hypothetical protein [Mesorhizobium sp. J428]
MDVGKLSSLRHVAQFAFFRSGQVKAVVDPEFRGHGIEALR